MKNFIKPLGLIALVLVALFSCDKKDSVPVEEQKEQMYAVNFQLEGAASSKGVLVGTKPELEKALKQSDGPLVVKKVSKSNNVFEPVVGTTNPSFDQCWTEIHNYYEAHYAEWLQTANQNCKKVMICLTCPEAGEGLFVLYEIKPTAPKCLEAVLADVVFSPFNFGKGQYESGEVGKFIDSKTR
ncbi:hypothetical protein [Sphingobacterium faecale]|uniref:Lipoprotein n=1 Tax=Sphingobacterium faecale TaxID=2803775 RepID=A0ABS1R336_9SPHI|nr:hypothetical protein [Sphingobacterium faecale]MBL1408442.1 hypothetical protein [Sphingobacterium faecale]